MHKRLVLLGICVAVALTAVALKGVSPAVGAGGGTISGTVYVDLNMNGQRDPGEPPGSSRTVRLVQYTDGEQNVEKVTQSGPDGRYSFDGLPETSTYEVGIDLDSQTICAMDSSGDILPSDSWTNRDLGVVENGDKTISGVLVNDLNANGVHDSSEPGIGGWHVEVGATDDDGAVYCAAHAITDADGRFVMNNLPPLKFELGLNQPTPAESGQAIATFPTAPNGPLPGSLVMAWTVDLSGAGQQVQTQAGFHFLTGSSSIAGLVYTDSNLDGTREANEPIIDCATIGGFLQAYWHVSAGTFPVYLNGQIAPETSCQNGRFEIDGLEAGNYTIGMPWCGLPGTPAGQLQGPSEQTVSVGEGQRLEGVDLALCSDPRQGMPVPVPPPVPGPVGAPPSPTATARITSPNTGSGPQPATSSTFAAAFALAFAGAGALTLTIGVLRRRRS